MPYDFVKSHGLGNDYIVLDEARLTQPLTAEAVRRICDVHYGVGSDGILLLAKEKPAGADFAVRIFNPDGGEAEKSGNGLRILAKFLYDHGYTEELEDILTTVSAEELAKNGFALCDGKEVEGSLEIARSRIALSTASTACAAASSRPISSWTSCTSPCCSRRSASRFFASASYFPTPNPPRADAARPAVLTLRK